MQSLAAAQLIDLCERGRGLPPVRQALLLLEAACPGESPERLAELPVGRRDARLLAARACTFGSTLESETRCPACDERLEFSLPTPDLLDDEAPDPQPQTLRHAEYDVTFRLPTSRDLIDVGDGAGAPQRVLTRCVVDAHGENGPVEAEALPNEVAEAVMRAMAVADPLADQHLALTCPSCAHTWSVILDVPAFFWAEVEAWAPRVLAEVHRLASAYGWHERDILAMSPWRREQYLNLLDA